MALTSTVQYRQGVTKENMPECVKTLAEELTRTYPSSSGFDVTAKGLHSVNAAQWFVYVHRGLTGGFSVLVSAPLKNPTKVTLKVAPSSRLLTAFTILGLVIGAVVGILVATYVEVGPESDMSPFMLGVLAACVATLVMAGVGSVVAKNVAGSATNPFTADKLKEIAAQVGRAIAREAHAR